MVARAFTILMFHSTASALLRWSAGVYLLRSASQSEDKHTSSEKPSPSNPGPSSQDMQSLPTIETLRPVPTRARHSLSRMFHQTRLVFTPPLCAAVLAIIVATVRPLQKGLEQHLKPVVLAVNDAGACSIPVTLVVLGAYFWKGRRSHSEGWSWRRWLRLRGRPAADDAVETERLLGRRRAVFLPIVARMVITPAILFPVSYILVAKRIAGFGDPVLVTSTILVICSPPAISLAQMSYQAGSETFDELISSVLLWGYAFTPLVTLIAAVVGPTFAEIAVKA
ncbi:hypothetical protein AURDEDRAFT_109940 [Auricularia subglabra TFB-10046 SS5]|nr:hypothetical protein AURDEDRAFT_109940 [Auricularia subglabra TFB-10046 SS5]